MKRIPLILFLFFASFCFGQDTLENRGTIKIGKQKPDVIYIKAIAKYENFDLIGLKRTPVEKPVPPFPFVSQYGYSTPFDYTRFFQDNFSGKMIDLGAKEIDTVTLEIKVLKNGKAYVRDKSKMMMIKGVPAIYDEKRGEYELNNLHVYCINFMKSIKKWFPAYAILTKKTKFRSQTVIKPEKIPVDCTGTVMIIFSTSPFED